MLKLLKALKPLRRKIPLHPDPDYRERRLAQMTPSRRERYFDNVRKAGL